MPSTTQGGGHTLTFAKKNKDVQKIIEKKKKQGLIITDYICEAVRAFENNQNSSNINITELNVDIEKIVKEQVAIALGKANEIDKKISLESDLDDVDIVED